MKYYYYKCKNKECKFQLPAVEVESVVLERIKELSKRPDILENIVGRTNERLQQELPQLRERKRVLGKSLGDIKGSAAGILRDIEAMVSEESKVFVREKLDELGKRRKEVEDGIQALDEAIGEMERESVDAEQVAQALGQFSEVLGELPPYRHKELVQLVVHRVELVAHSMKMALYGRVLAMGTICAQEEVPRCQTSN